MAKIEIVRYQCDVCKKEFENKEEVKSESVPCYGEGSYHSQAAVDMCNECAKKIRKVIFDNFAEIRDYYGLSVEKKF